jgi:hypothetical protein
MRVPGWLRGFNALLAIHSRRGGLLAAVVSRPCGSPAAVAAPSDPTPPAHLHLPLMHDSMYRFGVCLLARLNLHERRRSQERTMHV